MGIVIFGAMALYLVVSIAVVVFAARAAKKKGRSPWRWGGGAAFVMYLLVFWDHIPTLVAHQYYCEKEAGFWVYKTVGQWKTENPGVAEVLKYAAISDEYQIGKVGEAFETTYAVNQRIRVSNAISYPLAPLLRISRVENRVIDSETKQVLTKQVAFEAGHTSGPPKSLTDLKTWINLRQCIGITGNTTPERWGEIRNAFLKMGARK